MTRPASRSWFRAALSATLLVAIVVVQFRLVSWAMSSMVSGTAILGPFRVSEVAAVVMILAAVSFAVFIADGWRGFGLFTVIAALSSSLRLQFMIVNIAMFIAMSMAQAGTVYLAGRLLEDAAAGGGDTAPPMNLVPGFSFAIGDPILTALGCLLPICMFASVVVLAGQIAGPSSPTAALGPEREPTVTRL